MNSPGRRSRVAPRGYPKGGKARTAWQRGKRPDSSSTERAMCAATPAASAIARQDDAAGCQCSCGGKWGEALMASGLFVPSIGHVRHQRRRVAGVCFCSVLACGAECVRRSWIVRICNPLP